MKVCFWSTTFQADNQALAHYLSEQDDFEVIVAMDRPEAYLAEPVCKILPFRGRMIERKAWLTGSRLRREKFDLMIADNHLPRYRVAPRIFVLWHGFGWRIDDLSGMRKQLARLVGDVTRPNPNFLWQAFGEWDREYRISHSKIAPENVRALGSAFSDLLLPETSPLTGFDRATVADAYTIDITSRKTILMGLTWHHGGALGHWGNEAELLSGLFRHAASRGANVLMRMHDSFRYPAGYPATLKDLVSSHDNVQLKWKDTSPDSLVDLLVSDVIVSNYSSFLNHCYYTGKPTIHVDPADAEGVTAYRRFHRGKSSIMQVTDQSQVWKLSPAEHGGIRVRSFEELLHGIDRGLSDPRCCHEAARAFMDRYISCVDNHTRSRMMQVLRTWGADRQRRL